MEKSAQAFRTIREVAEWLDVAAHVLRFWESKFSQIKPVKRAGGRRYYRPADMELVGGIKVLLHDRGLTIRGVQKIIADEGLDAVTSLSPPVDTLIGNGETLDMTQPDAWAADTAAEAAETANVETETDPLPEAAPNDSTPAPEAETETDPEPAEPAAVAPMDPPEAQAELPPPPYTPSSEPGNAPPSTPLPAVNSAEGSLAALAILAQLPASQRALLRPHIEALARLRDRISTPPTIG